MQSSHKSARYQALKKNEPLLFFYSLSISCMYLMYFNRIHPIPSPIPLLLLVYPFFPNRFLNEPFWAKLYTQTIKLSIVKLHHLLEGEWQWSAPPLSKENSSWSPHSQSHPGCEEERGGLKKKKNPPSHTHMLSPLLSISGRPLFLSWVSGKTH